MPPPSFRATLAAAFLALDVAGVALILAREGADTVGPRVARPAARVRPRGLRDRRGGLPAPRCGALLDRGAGRGDLHRHRERRGRPRLTWTGRGPNRRCPNRLRKVQGRAYCRCQMQGRSTRPLLGALLGSLALGRPRNSSQPHGHGQHRRGPPVPSRPGVVARRARAAAGQGAGARARERPAPVARGLGPRCLRPSRADGGRVGLVRRERARLRVRPPR